MHKYTKGEAIQIVTTCAHEFKKNLQNKSLLFICMDKYGNVSFREFYFYSNNYLHMTGLKLKRKNADTNEKISAAEFFNKCIAHKLSENDFEFSDDGITHMKLDVLPLVITKNLSANMIGDYNSYNPKLYTEKLVGGIKACVGFVHSKTVNGYVPNTVLKVDIRDYITNTARVIAVFRKDADRDIYEEMTYRAKGVDLFSVKYPVEYAYITAVLRGDLKQ